MKNNLMLVSALFFLFIIIMSGCYFDTNTTDAMCSDNISSSKKNSLFLNEYTLLDENKKVLSVKESWIEYNWRNETMGLGIVKMKTKTGGLQLNILLEDTDQYFSINNFYKTWRIRNNMGDYLALNNNLCCSDIGTETPPDSIYLMISKIDSAAKYHDFEEVVFVKKK